MSTVSDPSPGSGPGGADEPVVDHDRTRDRLKVLVVLDAFKLGGAETLIAQLGRVAADAGLDLDVLSLHGFSAERSKLAPMLVEAGLEPHYLDMTRTLDPAAFARLVRYLRRTRPDVVHAHLEMSMTAAVPAGRLAGIPVVSTFHHVHRPLTGRAAARERLAVEVAGQGAATVFVSNASLTSFADRYRPGRDVPANWTVVHNGIDLDYYAVPDPADRPSLPAEFGLAGHPVVTIVAALRDFKGIQHAIRAWPTVLARRPEARLLLVGSGEEEASLRAEVSALGIGDTVIFGGMRTDIPQVMAASDVMLLPSIYGENLPTVLMEAGGCGRPVIASDVGGISDIVADGETGLLCPPGDSPALAAAMLRLLDDPALGDRLGAAGRERMEWLFDARVWAANLRSTYLDAIGGGPRSASRSTGSGHRGGEGETDTARPRVVVVAEARPMRGGIATFAETITDDPGLNGRFEMELLNTARVATREGGRFSLANVAQVVRDTARTFAAARRADIVHVQLVADPGLPSLRAAALNLAGSSGRARLIAHVHSAVGNAGRPEFATYSRVDRLALRSLRRADLVCTVSDAGTATMRRFAGSTPVETVDNAVDVDAFTPAGSTADGDRTPPTVLFVGVVCRRKGTLELARAARQLRDRGVTDWRLVVVGGQGPTPEPEYAEIVAEFAAAGLSDSLVGPEHGDQVKQRLAEADVFVLPSYLEGQPIAIIEAMAAGVPVVGTRIGAVPDLIRDGVDGRVVEPGDVDALAEALEDLISHPDRRRAMSASIRARAEAAHSLQQLSRRLTERYTDVLGRDCGARSRSRPRSGDPCRTTDSPTPTTMEASRS